MFTFAGIKDPNQNPKIKIMDSNTNGAHSAIAKKAKEDRFQGHDYYLIDELLDDVVEVLAYGFRCSHERWQAGATRPGEPVDQFALDDVGLLTIKDIGEGLLEQISAVQPCVLLLQGCEPGLLLFGEVPRILE